MINFVSGCSEETRAVFNEKLVTFLSKEFMEYVQRSSPSSAEKVQGAFEFNSLKYIKQTPLQVTKFGLICTSIFEQHLEVYLWADSY